jgi:tetraacyldisaccharide 4'-kinase
VNQIRQRVADIVPGVVIAESVHRPLDLVNADRETAPLASIAGRSVVAFCGLGNPQSFRNTLMSLGVRVTAFRAYPDHHAYSAHDLRDLQRWVRTKAPGGVAVTSQKDLVKLRRTQMGGRDLWALRVRLEFVAGQDEIERLLWPFVARGTDVRAA